MRTQVRGVPWEGFPLFTTCIHCNSDLGRNEAFETFPIGTRLAFDAANGRLWVVCRSCARWNLSPLDERWETIEAPSDASATVVCA